MIETFRSMIGQPPVGYEALEYIVSALVFLILFQFVANIFNNFVKFFTGK